MQNSAPSSSSDYIPSLKVAFIENQTGGSTTPQLALVAGVTTTARSLENGAGKWVYPWDGLSDPGYEAAFQTSHDCARTTAYQWSKRDSAHTGKSRTILGIPRRPATKTKDSAESLVAKMAKKAGVQVSWLSEAELSQLDKTYDLPYTPCAYYAVPTDHNDPSSNRKLYSAAPAVREADIPGYGDLTLVSMDNQLSWKGRFLSEEDRRRIMYTWKRSHDWSNAIDGLPLTSSDPEMQIKSMQEQLYKGRLAIKTSAEVVSAMKDRQAGLISFEEFKSKMNTSKTSAFSTIESEANPFVAPWEVEGDTHSTATSRPNLGGSNALHLTGASEDRHDQTWESQNPFDDPSFEYDSEMD